jgi:hypothetical protein
VEDQEKATLDGPESAAGREDSASRAALWWQEEWESILQHIDKKHVVDEESRCAAEAGDFPASRLGPAAMPRAGTNSPVISALVTLLAWAGVQRFLCCNAAKPCYFRAGTPLLD